MTSRPHRKDVTHVLSEVNLFFMKSFEIRRLQKGSQFLALSSLG